MSHKIGLFIDSENTNPNHFDTLYQKVLGHGYIIVSHIYGDWGDSCSKSWKCICAKYGLLKIQCDKISGKNSVDIKMCVDIMKYLYTNPHITMFCLITSDCDFRHVFFEIKANDKKICCIGTGKTNENLTILCDDHKHNIDDNKSIIISKIWDCLKALLKNKKKNVNGSEVISAILKAVPAFKYKDYGCKNLSTFLKKYFENKICVKNGNIKIK